MTTIFKARQIILAASLCIGAVANGGDFKAPDGADQEYNALKIEEKSSLIGKRLYVYPVTGCSIEGIRDKPAQFDVKRYQSDVPMGFTVTKLVNDSGSVFAPEPTAIRLGITLMDSDMAIPDGTPAANVAQIKRVQDQLRGKGVLILSVAPVSLARRAGLMTNDVLTSINDQPIAIASDVTRVMAGIRPKDKLAFNVTRYNAQKSIQTSAVSRLEALYYQVALDDGATGYIPADATIFFEKESVGTSEKCISEFSPEQRMAVKRQRQQELEAAEAERKKQVAEAAAQAEAQAKRPGARIGMTPKQVIDTTNWGKPESVNRTITATGTDEQWVYGNGNYLYFRNGKLRAIQN